MMERTPSHLRRVYEHIRALKENTQPFNASQNKHYSSIHHCEICTLYSAL